MAHLDGGQVLVASGAGGYSPLFYWVIGTVSEPFSGTMMLYVMRASAALLCLLFIGMAAWAVGVRRRSRWTRVGLVVAMTPVMLYSTSLPAPNGLEMAAALTFWCALLGLDGSLPRRHEWILMLMAIASATVLMIDRTLGPLFALLVLLAVWLLRPSLVRRVVVEYRGTFVTGSVVVLAGAAWAGMWFFANGSGEPAAERQGGDWKWVLPFRWAMQSIAAVPFRDQPGAAIVYPVVAMAFTALVIAGLRAGGRRERLVVCAVLLASVAIPLLLTAATYGGRGAMWQGRYGLPFAVGIVLLAGLVLDEHQWSTRFGTGLVTIGSVLMAVSTAACYLKVLDEELGRSVSLGDAAWHPPNAVLVAAVTALAWLVLHLGYARDDHALA